MFSEDSNVDCKETLLSRAHEERTLRAEKERRDVAAVTIQSAARGYLARRKYFNDIRMAYDQQFLQFKELDRKLTLPSVTTTFKLIKRLFFIYRDVTDRNRLLNLSRYLLLSIENTDTKLNFGALAISKDYIREWVELMKLILWQNCRSLESLKPDLPTDTKLINLHLHMLVTFTACNSWGYLKSKQGEALKPTINQLCGTILSALVAKGLYMQLQTFLRKGLSRRQPIIKHASLSAIISISLRPLISAGASEELMTLFVAHVLSIPGLVHHLSQMAPECLALFLNHKIFDRSLTLLSSEQATRVIFQKIDSSYSLCLLANIIHLATLEKARLVEQLPDLTNVLTRLLENCTVAVVGKKSSKTYWHPVLGWFSHSLDTGLHDAIPIVVSQLQLLWHSDTVKCLFSDLVNLIPADVTEGRGVGSVPKGAAYAEQMSSSGAPTDINANELIASVKNLFRKVVDQRNNSQKSFKKFGTPETTIVALVCSLYQSTLTTLAQLRFDILSGLCHQDFLLPRLWHFISTLGHQNGLKPFLELLVHNPKATCPEFQILILFCDTATYLLTILDDVELYDNQRPFSIQTLAAMCQFMNSFVYKTIWDSLIDVKSAATHPLFQSTHSLMTLLYGRDCRRPISRNVNLWLISEIKPSVFMSELERGNQRAEFLVQKVPHIIPHKERVLLFRKYVGAERDALGLNNDSTKIISTLISVHRDRIVEGLDEAGIDQDGVFKEFLEETVKRVFNPSLNLFKETDEGRLYPSATSGIHENHLALFDFVGRILAKAVYEGIVVEVPFATFFLNNLLGRTNSATYSSIDELPSLDPDLYKNLTFLKHYDGDLTDLDLTFSCVEDCMGQMVTHELIPGGKTIVVTNENRISYIHLMAHFRMHVQIRDQVQAFVKGFRALIRPEWLNLFSGPELQKLISGDTEDVDIEDLKRFTQYFGGFHSSHRVIMWLWDILAHDFKADDRKQFLRFVTSCSKPPLLGFAYMQPPFSIRCVEVSDDQDQGDTLGSVIRGFLSVRRREPIGRLPTSSTCFNLLKLPNYQKKQTLREKLRYAINSGTGFELS